MRIHPLNPLSLAVIALAASLCAAPAADAKDKPKAAATAKASTAPLAAPTLVRELEGIKEYRLANGLQVLLFADASASTTLVNLVYRVGSRHEGAGEAGMAHLLEHLLFKGTPSVKDIPKAMSERGVRFNATTTVDRTNYFGTFNANADTLAWLLTLEAERMQQSRVEAEDLAKEMPVVMNELDRAENEPSQLLGQRLMAAAYRFHPYGKPTIGTRSDVANVPITNLRAFYKAHYRPDNATLIVAGQVDEAATLALINQRFGRLVNPSTPRPASYTVEPPQDGERSVVVRRVGGTPVTRLAYHVPPFAHPDCAALSVLGPMVSQPPSGPLYKALVESKQAAQVFAGGCGGHDPGLFNVVAVHAAGTPAAQVDERLLAAIEQLDASALTQEQFDRIKSQFTVGYAQLLKVPQQLASLLTEAVAAGDWRLIFKLVSEVNALQLSDVQRVASTYLRPNNRTLARYEPVATSGQVEVPSVADRSAGLDRLTSSAVVEGERLDPSPSVLQARTQFSTLPQSGFKLALLPKKTRGDQVAGTINISWGEARAMLGFAEAAFVASQLTEGNARYTKQQLIDESVKLKGSFSINGGSQGLTLSLSGERATFVPLLKLAMETLKNPTFPQDAFDRAQRDAIKGLADSRSEPETLRREATRAHYNSQLGLTPDHPDYVRSVDESIARIQGVKLDAVRAFHQRFWSASEGEAAFVGALPEGFAAVLDAELAGWKKPGVPAYQRWLSPFKPVAPATFHAQAPDKASAVLRIKQELQLTDDHPDMVPLNLANHLLGGGSLESRLNVRLRQQGSLTYGIYSSVDGGDFDDSGSFSISTTMAPENRDKAIAAIREVIGGALKDGFTAADVERARKDLLEQRRLNRSSDGGLLGSLGWLLDRDRDWRYSEALDARYRSVSLAEVNAALRKHIKPEAWVISSAGDYAKKPPVAP